jgi:hypothetical protein
MDIGDHFRSGSHQTGSGFQTHCDVWARMTALISVLIRYVLLCVNNETNEGAGRSQLPYSRHVAGMDIKSSRLRDARWRSDTNCKFASHTIAMTGNETTFI